MKKLLSLLATVSLVSTSTASIVACGNGDNGPIDEDDNIKQDISTIISETELGDINFYSFSGNDTQTQTEIINQIRTLNPNAGGAQIDISNINPINGTAAISALGFSGSLTITFTPPRASEAEPMPISFPSTSTSMIQLQDGTILVAGGGVGVNSFLALVDLSDLDNPQTQILPQGLATFPSVPNSMVQLQDGTILVAGGTTAGNSFLALVDLSNSQTQILPQGAFPSVLHSITQLQNGTILAVGGAGATSFLSSVDLSDPANPQIHTLTQGLFPSFPSSITQLQDGTFLVVGGDVGATSFLASVDLSDPANPQTQILAQGLPPFTRSITELQDGTILVAGGTAADGWTSSLALVDLSNTTNPVQILAQGLFTSIPRSIIELQDGTILAVGGAALDGSDSFLRII